MVGSVGASASDSLRELDPFFRDAAMDGSEDIRLAAVSGLNFSPADKVRPPSVSARLMPLEKRNRILILVYGRQK